MKRILDQIWLRLNILLPKDNERIKILVLCFLRAMIFWVFRALNKVYTTELEYPIEFVYDNPDSFSVVKPLPRTVEVELKGGGWVLLTRAIEYSSVPIAIPIKHPDQTKKILTSSLRSTFRSYFQDVDFLGATPDSFSIDIERKSKKKVKLYVDPLKVSLAPQYILSTPPKLQPDSATFTGPESYIKSIPDSVEVSIPGNDIDEDLQKNIDLESFNSKLISISPDFIVATGKVTKLIHTRRKVYAHLVHFPKTLSVTDSACWISYTIREPFSNDLADMDFDVAVDFLKMKPDSTVLPELIGFPAILESIKLDSIPLRVCKKKPVLR
ncbi:MAG: hypothetical protein MI784_11640 [Cytophagales bacterium]|nr:hypothetical protein [Cytophagales bacterium]